jgi:enoyl-CoA hydratase/carnithine racemase
VSELILRDDTDGVATLTLNRPDKLNALNPAAFVELRSHIDALATQTDSVGCVVLTGAGRSFCAGNDLAAISAREQAPSPHFQAETIDALEALPQPVIVANSWGTSRIDKLLLSASARMPRDEALPHERSAPYGFPDDLAERLARG